MILRSIELINETKMNQNKNKNGLESSSKPRQQTNSRKEFEIRVTRKERERVI